MDKTMNVNKVYYTIKCNDLIAINDNMCLSNDEIVNIFNNGELKMIMYLFEKKILTLNEIKSCDILQNVCNKGYIAILKYLFEIIMLTRDNIDNITTILCDVCSCDKFEILTYLECKMKITIDDIRCDECVILRVTCFAKRFRILDHLLTTFKLNANDFRVRDNEIFKTACMFGDLDLIEYLFKAINFTFDDINTELIDVIIKNGCVYIFSFIFQLFHINTMKNVLNWVNNEKYNNDLAMYITSNPNILLELDDIINYPNYDINGY